MAERNAILIFLVDNNTGEKIAVTIDTKMGVLFPHGFGNIEFCGHNIGIRAVAVFDELRGGTPEGAPKCKMCGRTMTHVVPNSWKCYPCDESSRVEK